MAKKKAAKKSTRKVVAKKKAPKRAKAAIVKPTKEYHTKKTVASGWQPNILRAILAVALGIYLIANPRESLATFAVFVGVFLLAEGFLLAINACTGTKQHREWGILLFRSMLGILTGLFVLVQGAWFKSLTETSVVYIVAVLAIIIGLLEMTHAFQLAEHVKNRYLMTLSGLLALIFGILVLFVPIMNGVAESQLALGIYTLIFGVGLLLFSFELKLVYNRT